MTMNLISLLIVFFGSINVLRMGMFLIGSDLYEYQQFRKRKRSRPGGAYPGFTVVIPAHNEKKTILRAIHSVLNNDYPANKLLVLVADDGSTDGTAGVVRTYKRQYSLKNLRLISRKNKGKANALNYTMKKYAKTTLVMCLDADSYLETGALKKAARYFRDKRIVALASNVKIIPQETIFNLIQRFEYILCYQMKRAQTVFNIEYIVGGIGSVFRRTRIEQIGYYDGNTVTEDIDLTMKLLQKGNIEQRIVYGSDVIAHTESVLSLSDLISQRFRWKWGRTQTFYKNLNLFFNRDEKYSKGLTFLYLPFALFSDIAFLFEPLLIAYILYLLVRFGDIVTLVSAFLVMSAYITSIVLLETTISRIEKVKLVLIAPSMYFLFYILSLVEYIALIKMLVKIRDVRKSVQSNICEWQHVARLNATV